MKPRAALNALLAVTVSSLLVASCAPTQPVSMQTSEEEEVSAAQAETGKWRWVGLRGIEVQAPRAWDFDYEAIRPDCIRSGGPRDPWAEDVPDSPYVTVGSPERPVPMIGCLDQRRPGDPPLAFGDVPFPLWQPYVKLEPARPDLEDPGRSDGDWEHRGWRLTRETIDGVLVTVLAPPGRPALAQRVLSFARRVQTTSLGCEPTSPVQAERFVRPDGPPIPAAEDVAAVAVCEYSREPGAAGLDGSTRITGPAARELVEAIRAAPRSGGPDEPHHCVPDMYGDRAIALRFFGGREQTASPLAEAFVYYDWCFGNGIFDSAGSWQLTRANCAPLFAEAPISLWAGQRPVMEACSSLGSG